MPISPGRHADAGMTAAEAATHASAGLVVIRGEVVSWTNEAARDLVAPHGSDWTGPGGPAEVVAAVRPGTRRSRVYWPSPDGGVRSWLVTCTSVNTSDPALLYEITDATGGTDADELPEHRAREELAYLADHDPLTGVANRRRISARLAECGTDIEGAALLLIDIDNFKDINDLHGHAAGDRVIRRIASTVAHRIGPDAMLGRLGGDEFAVVVPRADAARGVELAEQLCRAVAAAPIIDAVAALRVTISIGVAVALGDDVEAGLAQADLALYEAKNSGRNRARLFAPDQYDQAVRRVSLLRRVGGALDSGTMQLDAQPIVDLATGRTSRYELLIRLRDDAYPILGPVDFLPPAERTDLVLRLDRWVLQQAVEALAAPRARASGLRLEVNVSARSLEDDGLGVWILGLLGEMRVEPSRLGLEITETAAIGSVDAARALATLLTEVGCGFALDDFGEGFGSFSYLKHLPFTSVKIAGEFVRELDESAVDRALVTAVVGVARQIGMRTVAENVDRTSLVEELRVLGVDDGQGYHLGVPRPLHQLLGRSRPGG